MYIILDIFIDPVLNFKLHISSIGSKVSNSCSGASLLEWFQSYRNNTNLTGQDSSRETSVVAYPPPPPHADPFSNLPITNGKNSNDNFDDRVVDKFVTAVSPFAWVTSVYFVR